MNKTPTRIIIAVRKYSRTAKGAAARRRYQQSAKGKATMRARLDRLRATRAGNAKYLETARRAQTTPNGRWISYRAGARNRDIPFELTPEQFAQFWRRPCTYCGEAVETIGLDRIDNARGYELGNVAPCCAPCNRAKAARPAVDFLAHCRRVTAWQDLVSI